MTKAFLGARIGGPFFSTLFFSILISILTVSQGHGQTLTPGDGVRLTIFNVSDDISGDYFIQEDWAVQLPFVGIVDCANRDWQNIRSEIVSKYGLIYRSPELTVQPLFRINVLGAVRSPGLYYVTGVETLTDLLAMASVEDRDAKLDKVYFLRDGEKNRIDAERIIKEGLLLTDIGLRSGDQVFVPRKGIWSLRNVSILFSGTTVLVAVVSLIVIR